MNYQEIQEIESHSLSRQSLEGVARELGRHAAQFAAPTELIWNSECMHAHDEDILESLANFEIDYYHWKWLLDAYKEGYAEKHIEIWGCNG